MESSQDQLEWTRVSSYRRSPPFMFRLSYEAVAGKGSWMRGRARDGWGNEGGSAPLFVPGTEGQ